MAEPGRPRADAGAGSKSPGRRERDAAGGRLTRRRLFGFDRSGPDPRETRSGEPLRPWTIPNAVGYLRLAAIPLFLYLAFESDEGRTFWSALVFWLIAVGDYVDGFVARATGQYSRMGALLDPIVDRLLILAGAAVCWHFELLPRWALAIVAAREVAILILAQVGLRRGVDVEINWLGRLAVWFVMGGLFLALSIDSWIAEAMFLLGLAMALAASVVYIRAGLARLRQPDRTGSAGEVRKA